MMQQCTANKVHPLYWISDVVTIQFDADGSRVYVKCPYNAEFNRALKLNLTKDDQTYYEWDKDNRQWVIYLWGETWPMDTLFNLLFAFYPRRTN
ncbi:MAG: hypothetical protein PHW28_06805 [Mesotoga sp.]|nr:hypothetical protein [Mesotoga sp.]